MDPHGGWECKPISLKTNTGGDGEGADTFPIKLFGRMFSPDVGGEEPDFVANSKSYRFVFDVIVLSLEGLSNGNCFNEPFLGTMEMFHEIGCCRNISNATGIHIERGMVTVVGIE